MMTVEHHQQSRDEQIITDPVKKDDVATKCSYSPREERLLVDPRVVVMHAS